MITYTIKYKLPNQWFWRKVSNIKEDGIVEETGARWAFDKYNIRYEFPSNCLFIFDEDRHVLILELEEKNKKNMSNSMTIPTPTIPV